jgi:hypothetical protein
LASDTGYSRSPAPRPSIGGGGLRKLGVTSSTSRPGHPICSRYAGKWSATKNRSGQKWRSRNMETEGLRRAQQHCSARALCKRKQRWHCLDCGTIEFGHYFTFGPLQAVPRTTVCFVSIAFNDVLAGSRSLRTSPPSFRAPGSHMSCIHKIAKARRSALVRVFPHALWNFSADLLAPPASHRTSLAASRVQS